MTQLLANMVVLGLFTAIHPTQTFAVILVLGTKGARANVTAFLVGWVSSLVAVFGFGYLAGGAGGAVTTLTVDLTSALEIGIGVALAVAAVVTAVRRDAVGTHAGVPASVVRRMDDLHPRSAAVIGVVVQPWAFTLAAAVTAARDSAGGPGAALALVTFGTLAAVPVVFVVVDTLRDPTSASARLRRLGDRLRRTSRWSIAGVSAVASIYLIVDGVRTFASR